MNQKLKELKTKHEAMVEQLQKDSQAAFKEAVLEIFEAFPAIKEFSWTQYTPYFNDGEECEFSVNNYPEINGNDSYSNPKDSGVTKDAYEAVGSLIGLMNENVMKAIFGDHVKVTVTRENISVDEYSHD